MLEQANNVTNIADRAKTEQSDLTNTTDLLRTQLVNAINQSQNEVSRLERELQVAKDYLAGNRGALSFVDQIAQQGAGVYVATAQAEGAGQSA